MIIVNYDTGLEFVNFWKEKNLTIGFTNGVFDLFHAGHAHSLTKAKTFCDKLIVGINSDVSTKILKGKDRPIISERERAYIVNCHKSVDMVIIFNEQTPALLLDIYKPDYWIKGSDWETKLCTMIPVPKTDAKMAFVNFLFLTSTTKIINLIKELP